MDLSIIITTHNYALYIEECLNSCLLQDDPYLDFEVIVVDDGSTDETSYILEKLNNKKLRKFRIENSGIEAASNFGFGKAKGKYLVRVDADDMLLPNYLDCIRKYLVKDFGFYYSDYEVINGDGKVVGEMKLPTFNVDEIRGRGDFLATGTVYSADILKSFRYYSEKIKNSGLENYDLILRMLAGGVVGKHIPNILFRYRRHNLNISISKYDQIVSNGDALFKRLGLGAYVTNEYHPYKPELRSL